MAGDPVRIRSCRGGSAKWPSCTAATVGDSWIPPADATPLPDEFTARPNRYAIRTFDRTGGCIESVALGFRSSFRDYAAERTHTLRAVMEAALAHVVKN